MTGVVHPVGPEEPVVYWRRRLMIALAALFTLFVLFRSLTGGDDPVPAAALASPSAEAVVTAPEVSPASSEIPATPAPTILQPTAQPVTPAVADGECSDADTSIRVEIDRETTAVGEGIHINMFVKNISAKTCKRDVGSGANEVTVISGPALIW